MGNSVQDHLKDLGYDANKAGLASIFQNVQAARQQNVQNRLAQSELENQTRQVNYQDPNRPISELDKLKAENNPLNAAIAQLLRTVPPNMGGVTPPVAPGTAQPAPAAAPNMAPQPTTPVPVNAPPPITEWTPDDLAGFQKAYKAALSKKQGT